MVHVSFDLVDEFIPRVPKQRCEGENNTIKRICVAPSIIEALNAIPQAGFVVRNMKSLGLPCLIGAGGAVPADRHAAVSTKYFWLSLLAIPFWFSSLLYFLTILLFAPEDLTILHDRFYQSQLGIFFLMLSSYFIITFLYVLVCHRQSRGDRSAADAPGWSVSANCKYILLF